MAMEKLYTVRDTHTRSLTALGINPSRREILIGCEGKEELTFVISAWSNYVICLAEGVYYNVDCEFTFSCRIFVYFCTVLGCNQSQYCVLF